jgi:hypothetical protein
MPILKMSPRKPFVPDQPIKAINIGDMIEKVAIKADEWEFFSINIKDQVYKDEDLLIKVIPLTEESDPDVYISKVR